MNSATKSMPLGERLIEAGHLNRTQLESALREQKRSNGRRLGAVLCDLGFIRPEVISAFLAEETGTELRKLHKVKIPKEVLALVPVALARRFSVLPLSVEDGVMTVAMADAFNISAIDTLEQVTGLIIQVVTASERDILNGIDNGYSAGDTIEESIDQIMEESPEQARAAAEGTSETSVGGDAPMIQLVEQILTRAIEIGASDIHVEPEDKILRIRLRIDGVLFQDVILPKNMQAPVIARLKIMGELNVAEQRIPQDGRANFNMGRREITLRISTLPTIWGENVVLRVLDPSNLDLKLSQMGFAPAVFKQLKECIEKPNGVILVTGPTGSGKTTTLYAILEELNTVEASIFTLEDPVEYQLQMIRQTQIRDAVGMSFGNGLRALLRQDPDILLVGETRDTETAQLMVRAALTGHLVFSTLHTNDAAGSIPRLVDMGVEPYLLPTALLAVIAQRLTRTICKDCKEEVPNPELAFKALNLPLPTDGPVKLWKGRGCSKCKNSGYKGRLGIYELLVNDERFHLPIANRAGASEYFRIAREGGMVTMFEDGMIKALKGLTTVEEVVRVTRTD
jgi:type II secretory ATPase GspE/PulE/Tfp pilus assembly ATPase PilB-like protein